MSISFAANERIKGQDTEIKVIKGGDIVRAITAVKDWEFTHNIDVTSQGYIGETTERKDSIYKGTAGKCTLDLTDKDAVGFLDDLVDRARRKVSYFKVNVLTTLNFPSGDTKRVIFQDVQFSSPNINAGSREGYLETTLNWECAEYKVL